MDRLTTKAEILLVRAHHIDMIRFVQEWITEATATRLDCYGKPSIFPASHYSSAIKSAICHSRLIVFTGRIKSTIDTSSFDALLAVIVLPCENLPVSPLILASDVWESKIDWSAFCDIVYYAYERITKITTKPEFRRPPQVVSVLPNAYGCRTASATWGPTAITSAEQWSFCDTLKYTIAL